jgi:very-short-patch-repair endonuclease
MFQAFSFSVLQERDSMKHAPNRSVIKARELRRTMSLPEGLLWQVLRRRPGGFKFRRQHPLGPFIVDFFCASRHLAIEVDGIAHDMGENPMNDAIRDAYLREHGIRIVRFAAKDVLRNMNGVVKVILAEASS